MRLDPIFLVAPKPKPPSMPTRRAFLLAGGMFSVGLGLGGACGYAAGVSSAGGGDAGPVDGVGGGGGGEGKDAPVLPPSSGDAELDNLRRLALVAPIEELVGEWLYFADVFATDYRKDPFLVRGIERLVEHVLANEGVKDRKLMAAALKQTIEKGEAHLRTSLQSLIEPLRQIR